METGQIPLLHSKSLPRFVISSRYFVRNNSAKGSHLKIKKSPVRKSGLFFVFNLDARRIGFETADDEAYIKRRDTMKKSVVVFCVPRKTDEGRVGENPVMEQSPSSAVQKWFFETAPKAIGYLVVLNVPDRMDISENIRVIHRCFEGAYKMGDYSQIFFNFSSAFGQASLISFSHSGAVSTAICSVVTPFVSVKV